jgi:hypothetical protein
MRQKLTEAFSRSRANSDLFSIYLAGWKRAPRAGNARRCVCPRGQSDFLLKINQLGKAENCKFDKTRKFLPNRQFGDRVNRTYQIAELAPASKVLAPPERII